MVGKEKTEKTKEIWTYGSIYKGLLENAYILIRREFNVRIR